MLDTKIVFVLRDGLATWQKLSVTACPISGIKDAVSKTPMSFPLRTVPVRWLWEGDMEWHRNGIHPNHDWVSEFTHGKPSNGRSCKMPTVLDGLTRQALAVTVRTKMDAERVLEVL